MNSYEPTTRQKRAKGTMDENGNRKIAIGFDGATFRKIADEAVQNNISFGEQVRLYVGLAMDRSQVSA
jgi:hypothetical protein